jgi:hypothetical protein
LSGYLMEGLKSYLMEGLSSDSLIEKKEYL